jgi:hypothetical protein
MIHFVLSILKDKFLEEKLIIAASKYVCHVIDWLICYDRVLLAVAFYFLFWYL